MNALKELLLRKNKNAKSVVFFFLLAFLCLNSTVLAQNYTLKAWLYESDSFTRVPFAVVSIKNKTDATISDESGYFEIGCNLRDTIVISHVSYQKRYISVQKIADSSKIKIYLRKVSVELVPVTISGNRLSKSKIEEYQHHLNRTRPTINSPISAVYEKFSRRGKERTKMDIIYSELLLRDQLERRMPPSKLFLITGNRSVSLDNLLLLCPVSSQFAIYATDYDFFYHFSKCWEEYKRLN